MAAAILPGRVADDRPFILATWYQAGRITDLREGLGKRIDDLRGDINARFGEVNARFTAVEKRLEKIETKVELLQERIWR